MADSISLADKLASFADHWSPRAVTTFNDCDVMVVKVKAPDRADGDAEHGRHGDGGTAQAGIASHLLGVAFGRTQISA